MPKFCPRVTYLLNLVSLMQQKHLHIPNQCCPWLIQVVADCAHRYSDTRACNLLVTNYTRSCKFPGGQVLHTTIREGWTSTALVKIFVSAEDSCPHHQGFKQDQIFASQIFLGGQM